MLPLPRPRPLLLLLLLLLPLGCWSPAERGGELRCLQPWLWASSRRSAYFLTSPDAPSVQGLRGSLHRIWALQLVHVSWSGPVLAHPLPAHSWGLSSGGLPNHVVGLKLLSLLYPSPRLPCCCSGTSIPFDLVCARLIGSVQPSIMQRAHQSRMAVGAWPFALADMTVADDLCNLGDHAFTQLVFSSCSCYQ